MSLTPQPGGTSVLSPGREEVVTAQPRGSGQFE